MMLLNGSIYTFVAGLLWLIFDGAMLNGFAWVSPDTKVI
ncbi:hypothetical protein BFJ65_g14796 [Fusarium oxysporum f. sp. cepae]|uniref:Uncharacterized protein n=1 Tax=Fusarium oxysporum f. sp. cepae TaxID=396571 RepID=A0A3L6N2J0_FUSOX|nr:hypothetical protein BFJ65_g14796 [Fusarium oxysporum f. sp. cepae]